MGTVYDKALKKTVSRAQSKSALSDDRPTSLGSLRRNAMCDILLQKGSFEKGYYLRKSLVDGGYERLRLKGKAFSKAKQCRKTRLAPTPLHHRDVCPVKTAVGGESLLRQSRTSAVPQKHMSEGFCKSTVHYAKIRLV